MPLLFIHSSVSLEPKAKQSQVLKSLSSLVAHELAKPEHYVMVALAPHTDICFSGTQEPAIYAELKNVGQLSTPQVEHLSHILCQALSSAFSVSGDRIYIEFTNVEGAFWGWNGGTFG